MQIAGEPSGVGPIYPIEGQSVSVAELIGGIQGDWPFRIGILVLGPPIGLDPRGAVDIRRSDFKRLPGHS